MTSRLSQIDWQRARAEFAVTERLAYLNTAATGPISRSVKEAAEAFYREMSETGDRRWERWIARRELDRKAIASLINADADEIAFTANTSIGMNLIVDALEGSGEVISCDLEFPVSTIPWMHRRIPVNLVKSVDGELRTDDVVAAMTPRTAVICLSHVQYSNGFRLDPYDFGREKGNHVLVINASQSAGVFPIDVKKMKIDALCSTGHKWMLAGYGSGFVYISHELLERTSARQASWMSVSDPFRMDNTAIDVRSDAAARAEIGCPQLASIFALGAATRNLLELELENIERRALELNRKLTDQLKEAGWKVLSPLQSEATRSAETLIAADDPKRTVHHLASHGIAVTIKPEGFRAATHYFNNEDDISRLIEALSLLD